ncbi:MAG: M48 family metalloprotease [Candidatus Sericytochromatia bacterium]|nr:M48 family metalloprotease [Candidatus Sericytochromatia bacterium]
MSDANEIAASLKPAHSAGCAPVSGRGRQVARALGALGLAGMLASSCVVNYAKGRSEFSLVSQAQELEMGRMGDKEILAQFGAYGEGSLNAFVERVGTTVAAHSDAPTLQWHFRVLDSPVVNAFALPGGYIYVSRGLLAYLQNEAQLAMILGHEIGHVTARHTAGQITRQNVVGLGLQLGGLFFEGVRPYMGLLQTGMQLLFLTYSRGDETAADALGVTYAIRAGYAAGEGAAFFQTLKRLEAGKQGSTLPTFLSTHPDPGDREKTILKLAAAAQQQSPGAVGKGRDLAGFLPKLDGVVFGEDPRQGFVRNGLFIHPKLAFQFPVPTNWKVHNLPSKVEMVPPGQQVQAAMLMQGAPPTTPLAAAEAFATANKATVLRSEPATVHGLAAHRLVSRVAMANAQGGTMAVTVASSFIRKGDQLFVLHGYAPSESFANVSGTFEQVFAGFAPLTDRKLLDTQPKRLDIVTLNRPGLFQAVVPNPAAGGVTATELSVLNQRQPADPVSAGALLKVVK